MVDKMGEKNTQDEVDEIIKKIAWKWFQFGYQAGEKEHPIEDSFRKFWAEELKKETHYPYKEKGE